MANLTIKQQRDVLAKIAATQSTGKRFNYADGSSLSRAQFIKMFKGIIPQLSNIPSTGELSAREGLAYVNIYTKVNACLAKSGMKFTAKNYYETMEVASGATNVQTAIDKALTKATNIVNRANELGTNQRAYAGVARTYSALSATEKEILDRQSNYHLPR